MATVIQYWNNPGSCYQADGTVEWTWKLGDRDFYWGFSVRPYQANQKVQLDSVYAVSDNDNNQATHLVVTVAPAPPGPNIRPDTTGTLLRFTAIKATTP